MQERFVKRRQNLVGPNSSNLKVSAKISGKKQKKKKPVMLDYHALVTLCYIFFKIFALASQSLFWVAGSGNFDGVLYCCSGMKILVFLL